MTRIIKVNFSVTCLNHILLKCKLNSVSANFILDSGASNSCVNSSSAEKFNLNIETSDEVAYSATGQINKTFHSKKNILEIASLVKKNFEIFLFDMTHINNSLIEENISTIDGIIGGDFLNEFNATINYKKRLLYLEF